MKLSDKINWYQQNYRVVGIVNLDQWYNVPDSQKKFWLLSQVQAHYRSSYDVDQRVLFTLTQGDQYENETSAGEILINLQQCLNQVDISNFFVCYLTNESPLQVKQLSSVSQDPVTITIDTFTEPAAPSKKITKKVSKMPYQYGSSIPIKADFNSLSERQKFLLMESKTFCMYPWVHLHAWPTGEAYPCCMSVMDSSVGNCKKSTMQEIWNDEPMRSLRKNMLSETASNACTRCYEQEQAGFFSGRQSANKHHGHHVHKVDKTDSSGYLDNFEMVYWDIRFSNLCNLKCRSCGHIFSSQWYQDQAKLAGSDWAKNHQVLNIAGRHENDMWEQLIPHLDYVEQIYFAGGEPLLMHEHYRILEELVKRGLFHVRLIYNTNFTHTQLKDKSVFEYWKLFDSVSVGASLDGAEEYAEYIRKGSDWDQIERNRVEMLRTCPQVDFYISPTLSIMNAWHLPDFHRNWVDRGYIRHKDLNVNILQDPDFYRIDIASVEYKKKLEEKYQKHLEWLRPHDDLQRATKGFESAINFMWAQDNSALQTKFWERTRQLDSIRNENIFDVIPELVELQ